MKKINLTAVKIYKDLSKKEFVTADIREELSNFIYNNTNGIQYHALALKMYNSDGIIEIDENEEKLINEMKEGLKPCVIDAIDGMLQTE